LHNKGPVERKARVSDAAKQEKATKEQVRNNKQGPGKATKQHKAAKEVEHVEREGAEMKRKTKEGNAKTTIKMQHAAGKR
jgi:hypothetical protein